MSRILKLDGEPVKVVDAKKNLPLHITPRDVRAGTLKDAKTCAAAKALCRMPGVEAARVNLSRTYVKENGKWTRYFTPPPLRNEIIAFDRGGEFAPGDYTLYPVQPIVQFKNREVRAEYMREYNKRKPKNKHPQKGNRAKPHVVSGVRAKLGND